MWWFESRKLFEYYKKRSCVSNRTDTSALSEWMVVRPFRSLVQLRGSPNASGLQTHDLFYNIPPIISVFKLQIRILPWKYNRNLCSFSHFTFYFHLCMMNFAPCFTMDNPSPEPSFWFEWLLSTR